MLGIISDTTSLPSLIICMIFSGVGGSPWIICISQSPTNRESSLEMVSPCLHSDHLRLLRSLFLHMYEQQYDLVRSRVLVFR